MFTVMLRSCSNVTIVGFGRNPANANQGQLAKVCPDCVNVARAFLPDLGQCIRQYPNRAVEWSWAFMINSVCASQVDQKTATQRVETFCWGDLANAKQCSGCLQGAQQSIRQASAFGRADPNWPMDAFDNQITKLCFNTGSGSCTAEINAAGNSTFGSATVAPDYSKICGKPCLVSWLGAQTNASDPIQGTLQRISCQKNKAGANCGAQMFTTVTALGATCSPLAVAKAKSCSSCTAQYKALNDAAGCCLNDFLSVFASSATIAADFVTYRDAVTYVTQNCGITVADSCLGGNNGGAQGGQGQGPPVQLNAKFFSGQITVKATFSKLKDFIDLYRQKAQADISGLLGVSVGSVRNVNMQPVGASVQVTFTIQTDSDASTATVQDAFNSLSRQNLLTLTTFAAAVSENTGEVVSLDVQKIVPKDQRQQERFDRVDTTNCTTLLQQFNTECSKFQDVFTNITTDGLTAACKGGCVASAQVLLEDATLRKRILQECNANIIPRLAIVADVMCERDGSTFCLAKEAELKAGVVAQFNNGETITDATLDKACVPCLYKIVRARERYNTRLQTIGLFQSNTEDSAFKRILSNLCIKNGNSYCLSNVSSVIKSVDTTINSSLCTDSCYQKAISSNVESNTGLRALARVYCTKNGGAYCGDQLTSLPTACIPTNIGTLSAADYCGNCTTALSSLVGTCCWSTLVRASLSSGSITQPNYATYMSRCGFASSIATDCVRTSSVNVSALYKFTGRIGFKALVSWVKANEDNVKRQLIADIASNLQVNEQDVSSVQLRYGVQVTASFIIQTESSSTTSSAETRFASLVSDRSLKVENLQSLFASDVANEGEKLTIIFSVTQSSSSLSAESLASCNTSYEPIRKACAGYEGFVQNTTGLKEFCQSSGCQAAAQAAISAVSAVCSSELVESAALLADVLCSQDSGTLCYADVKPALDSLRTSIKQGTTITDATLDTVCKGNCVNALRGAKSKFSARMSRFSVDVTSGDREAAVETALLKAGCQKESSAYCFPKISAKLQTVEKFFADLTVNDMCDQSSLCVSRFVMLAADTLGSQDQPKNASAVKRSMCAYGTQGGAKKRCGDIYNSVGDVSYPSDCTPQVLQGTSCPRHCQVAYQTRADALGCCLGSYNDAEADAQGSYTASASWKANIQASFAFCNVTLPYKCNQTFSGEPTKVNVSIPGDYAWCVANLDKCTSMLSSDIAASAGVTIDNLANFSVTNGSIVSSFGAQAESTALKTQLAAATTDSATIDFSRLQSTYSADNNGAVVATTTAQAATTTPTPTTLAPGQTNAPTTTGPQTFPAQTTLAPTPAPQGGTPQPPAGTPAPTSGSRSNVVVSVLMSLVIVIAMLL
jgi:hypothetical protein